MKQVYVISALAVVLELLVVGVAVDFMSFDRTKGGYEPPYTGYTSEPVNWNEGRVTEIGFYRDGYVVDTIFDCTSGEISFNLIGIRYSLSQSVGARNSCPQATGGLYRTRD